LFLVPEDNYSDDQRSQGKSVPGKRQKGFGLHVFEQEAVKSNDLTPFSGFSVFCLLRFNYSYLDSACYAPKKKDSYIVCTTCSSCSLRLYSFRLFGLKVEGTI
jgi:hypothetical protein